MSVLLTGACGYIGSHTAVELLEAGNDIVIVDNLSNSGADVIDRIEAITGKRPKFYVADVADANAVERIFEENDIEAVIHFAGYKAVGESVEIPIRYYRNNIDTTLTLLEAMERHGCKRFVFSSSATVYGENEPPLVEDMATGGCSNPYGWTKFMIEQILSDATIADPKLSVVLLRYFNPVGAHESGLIGEQPNGIPNNLMPRMAQAAHGILTKLYVFGDDYPTPDGTGVRDYIHVQDLANGHLAALEYTATHAGVEAVNLGTGTGYSVLELVRAYEAISGVKIPLEVAPRRPGDVAACYANVDKAAKLFEWHPTKGLEDMCRDSWRWEIKLKTSENTG